MRRLLTVLWATLLLPEASTAKHISGGELSYVYLGPGSAHATGRYSITLRLYRDCNAPSDAAPLGPSEPIFILERNATTPLSVLSAPLSRIDRSQMAKPDPCITNPPFICFDIGVYTVTVELPFIANGYDIVYQQCCRINNLVNIVSSANTNEAGYRYVAVIPGLLDHPTGPANSSPAFLGSDTVVVCRNTLFNYDFGAIDAEGDSLAYEFTEAYTRSDIGSSNQSLSYKPGYSSIEPMGPGVSIDRKTGRMSGRAMEEGIYVVTVQVVEYRNGRPINRHRKDLQLRVADCSAASVELDSPYINCDGFSLTFQNNNNHPLIKTHSWDFGVSSASNDVSDKERPSFTFPDTGVYLVRLITNRGLECSDTGYTHARIFPGFSGGFIVDDGCKDVPLLFTDTTNAAYGKVDSWNWEFGHPFANPGSSNLRNPSFTYPVNGTYDVRLIVGSDKGCRDTVDKKVHITGKPTLKVSSGLSICTGDSARLEAKGTGSFSWSPASGLSDASIPDPIAYPTVRTKYLVTLSNGPGCVNTDSVVVDVKAAPLLDAGGDTTVCLTDTVRLKAMSDGTRFSWKPAATLDDPSSKTPLARPVATTTYVVSAWLGGADGCTSTDSVKVTTVPYPKPTLSADTTICLGDSVLLKASGGVFYRWRPSTGLSDTTSATPTARPLVNTTYTVEVRDNAGCPKPATGLVLVKVAPKVKADAGRDTSIVAGQPLRLNGSGGDRYRWTPPTGLSDPDVANPVVDIRQDQSYELTVTGLPGCTDRDTVNIRVFKIAPDILMPTAFTPNGDGLNDLLTPIPVGVSEFRFFRLYNGWGKLVFSTSEAGKGWNGRVDGKAQPSQTLIWHVGGVGFDGRLIDKRGTTTLIR
jgi:gliding motility-associated-like protein